MGGQNTIVDENFIFIFLSPTEFLALDSLSYGSANSEESNFYVHCKHYNMTVHAWQKLSSETKGSAVDFRFRLNFLSPTIYFPSERDLYANCYSAQEHLLTRLV